MTLVRIALICMVATVFLIQSAQTETQEEWIKLGERVHGGFGAFIPVGIRIGLDALQRLRAEPRQVAVVYFDSDRAPCACVADGVAIATIASVGQRTLQIAPEKAPPGVMAEIIVRHKQSCAAVKYTISDTWVPKLIDMNKYLDARGRYDAVMNANGLFEVSVER